MAVCDSNVRRAKELADAYGVPRTYSDLDEMVNNEEIHLVDVCTPPQTHREVVMRAMSHQIDCIVEKPFAVTTRDAAEMIEASHRNGVKLFPIFDLPYLPGIRKAKQMVQSGKIGKLTGVNILSSEMLAERYRSPDHWCRAIPGDYFGDAEPHLVMLMIEFLGTVENVSTTLSNISGDSTIPFDELRVVARFQGGALGTIAHTANCVSSLLQVDIVGTQGRIMVDGVFNTVIHSDWHAHLGHTWRLGAAYANSILAQTKGLTTSTASILFNRYLRRREPNAHGYLLPRAIASLQEGSPYPVDLEDTRESVRFLELAFQRDS